MAYGRYFTRAASRSTTRGLKDAAKTGLGAIGAGYIKRLANRTSKSKRVVALPYKRLTKPFLKSGKRTKFSCYKSKPISNPRVKGVSKKFERNVKTIMRSAESWGEYLHNGNKQLRQTVTDEWNIENLDEFGTELQLDTSLCLLNVASCLGIVNRQSVNNIENPSGDLVDSAVPITVIQSQMEMYFKSTSSHSVNLELYECEALDGTGSSARDWADASWDDYQVAAARNVTALSPSIRTLGVEPRHMTSLHQHFKVKIHKIKLLPGETSSLVIYGKRKTWDFSQNRSSGGNTHRWMKGSKSMFFRIINDTTVSGTATNRIHQWASSDTGGIAMRYQTKYRIEAPKSAHGFGTVQVRAQNRLVIHQSFNDTAGQVDQQVAFYNPTSSGGLG